MHSVEVCFSLLVRDSCNATQEAQAYADENGLFFMETSAKTANNVNGAAHACVGAADEPR